MARFTCQNMLSLAPRLVMVALCLFPFSGPRQAAFAFGFPPPSLSTLPTSPVNEEEESQRTEDAKGRVCNQNGFRPEAPRITGRLLHHVPGVESRRPNHACLSPLDPFRNGLGSPYRC
jgi:hypothetical protein